MTVLKDWIQGFQASIDYMELNLLNALSRDLPGADKRIRGEPAVICAAAYQNHNGGRKHAGISDRGKGTVYGCRHQKKRFSAETSYKEVPTFWGEWMSDMKGLKGMFGVCSDMDGKTFDYWIADLYEPWKDIPAGCCTYQISGRRI